jgi:fibronectin type III domain protein
MVWWDTVPTAPTSLKETAKTATSVSLKWTQPSGTAALTDNVVLYGKTCVALTSMYNLGKAVADATIKGLSKSTSYCFVVEAVDYAGTSAHSATLVVKTAV